MREGRVEAPAVRRSAAILTAEPAMRVWDRPGANGAHGRAVEDASPRGQVGTTCTTSREG